MRWLEKLWKKIRKWWKKRSKHKPRKVQNVRTEITMTKNVTLSWDLPTERTGGGALPIEDIQDTRIEMSADGGANYGDLARILPVEAQEVFVPDLEPGEWHFRITVLDDNDKVSAPHIEIATVLDDSPPNPVSNVVTTQT